MILLNLIDKQRGRYLFLLPTLNLIFYPFLIVIHWITGKYGYLYSIILLLLTLVLLHIEWQTILSIRNNNLTKSEIITQVIGLLLVIWAGYVDLNFIWITLNNNGFFPCNLDHWSKQNGVELAFIQPGKPTQNAYVERFNGSLRTELLNAYVFKNLREVRQQTKQWQHDYNQNRPHEALNNKTPRQVLEEFY